MISHIKKYKGEFLVTFMPLMYSIGFIFTDILGSVSKILSFLSIIFFLYGINRLPKRANPSRKNDSLVTCLISYSLFSLVLTIHLDYDTLRGIFLNPAFILPFICPILSLKKFDYNILRFIIWALTFSSILFLLFAYYNFNEFLQDLNGRDAINLLKENNISYESVSKNFAACLGLGILFLPILKLKNALIILLGFVVNICVAIFLGRRNIIFTNGLYLLFAIYIYIRYLKMPKFIKKSLIFMGICLIGYGILNFTALLSRTDNPMFAVLQQRVDLDSRSQVIEYFDRDMNNMPLYWIVGKGIDSQYYCPNVEETNYRHTIESGWRHIILKVGIIGLVLYLLILLPAVFKKKRNIVTEALGFYILIGVIELYPAGVPTLYLQYVLLWIACSICSDNKFNKVFDNKHYSLLMK